MRCCARPARLSRIGAPARLAERSALSLDGLHEAPPRVRHARFLAGVLSDVCPDARRVPRAFRLRFG
jgi:hypothetical protein